MSGCRRCEIDVTHCHGSLVWHDDLSWECSAVECSGDPAAHDFVLTCEDVWDTCCGREQAVSRAG